MNKPRWDLVRVYWYEVLVTFVFFLPMLCGWVSWPAWIVVFTFVFGLAMVLRRLLGM